MSEILKVLTRETVTLSYREVKKYADKADYLFIKRQIIVPSGNIWNNLVDDLDFSDIYEVLPATYLEILEALNKGDVLGRFSVDTIVFVNGREGLMLNL